LRRSRAFRDRRRERFRLVVIAHQALDLQVAELVLSDVVSEKPWVAFNPSGMRNWRVFDVTVKKI